MERVEAAAVVRHFDGGMAALVHHRDRHFGRLGVLADVRQAFLHHAVDGQLPGFVGVNRFEHHLDLQARLVGEFSAQDFQGRDEPQVGQRRWTQVLDDAPFERDAAVEQFGQVLQALHRAHRRAATSGAPRRVWRP